MCKHARRVEMQRLQFCTMCAFLLVMAHLLGNLAAWAAQHWKRSLAIVAVVLVALGIAASAGGGSFVDDFRTPGTQSQTAMDVLDERFPAAAGDSANVVFAADSGTLREPERRA